MSRSLDRRLAATAVGTVTLGLALLAPYRPAVAESGDGPTAARAASCAGERATLVGTRRADRLIGTPGRDVIVAGAGGDVVDGRGGRDLVCAGAGRDRILGRGGGDSLVGGAGADVALGGAGSDILLGIGGGDRMVGGDSSDALLGGAGDDVLDGGPDADIGAYLDATAGVDVDLAGGTATGAGRDTLDRIESALGSPYGDRLAGGAGTDFFFGHLGDDLIDGRGGGDVVLLAFAAGGAVVDLAAGSGTGGEGSDGLVAVEHVVGTPYDDVLLGDERDNYLDGAAGADTVDGRGGENVCFAETRTSCLDILPTTTEDPELPARAAGSGTAWASRLVARLTGVGPLPGAPSGQGPEASFGAAVPQPAAGQPAVAPAAPTRADVRRAGRAAAGYGLSCPMLSGAILSYPNWRGYNYWAWRYAAPPLGWNVGPWLYNSNGAWIAHVAGAWYSVGNSSSWHIGGGEMIEALWFNYETNTWYSMGYCIGQAAPLIPGLMVYP